MKNKKSITKGTCSTSTDTYMSYDTYRVLNDFLESEMLRFHDEYVMATHMLEFDDISQQAKEILWQTYRRRRTAYLDMQQQLKDSFRKTCSPKLIENGFVR